MKPLDLTGKRFGQLVALRRIENAPGYGQARWLFLCDCGNETAQFGYSVVHQKVVSCGCWRKAAFTNLKHGKTRSREFNSWTAMRQRCLNHSCQEFENYGGRGITICDEWSDFQRFLNDMGPRPDGLSLERIRNNEGYHPGNCRWATREDQVRNRRTTVFYEHAGNRQSLQAWAEAIGVPYGTLWHRYKVGKRGTELLSPVTRGGGPKPSHKPSSTQAAA